MAYLYLVGQEAKVLDQTQRQMSDVNFKAHSQ